MSFDEEGFAYPSVDKTSCEACGRCISVCPLEERNCHIGEIPVDAAYAAANRSFDIRASSTSGGAFEALCRVVLERGGVVVGSRYGAHMRVEHELAYTAEDAVAFRGSKYVQSDLVENDVFRRVRSELECGRTVLFSGTPCQVQALRVFLGKAFSNLITCDFVCHAVPSPRSWQAYVGLMEKRNGSAVVEAAFRNKTYGYHGSSMRVVFRDGSEYYASARTDAMLKAYFADIMSRPSCYACKFRRTERSSDFTLFDCWSFSEHTGLSDDDLGWTNVWVRGDNALRLLTKLEGILQLHEVDLNATLNSDGIMAMKDIPGNDNREAFLRVLYAEGFDRAVGQFLPIKPLDRAIERFRGPLYKSGLMRLVRKFRAR